VNAFASLERWRRLARGLVPEEVTVAPRFSRRERLVEHVEKHPLGSRHERWHQVIAAALLSEARDELAAGGWGPACDRLADEYEGFVASVAVERCREGRGHAHLLTVRNPLAESLREARLEETVYAWDVETRILVIATRPIWSANPQEEGENVDPEPVRQADPPPYRLRTGYRLHADRSVSRFRAEMRRKLDDLSTFSLGRRPLWTVEHDGSDAPDASGSPTEPSHES
jgi:hypothetical protein